MAKYKFKYNGDDERSLPTHGRNVKPGDIIDTDLYINNPDFEEITGGQEHKEVRQEPKEHLKEEEVKE